MILSKSAHLKLGNKRLNDIYIQESIAILFKKWKVLLENVILTSTQDPNLNNKS